MKYSELDQRLIEAAVRKLGGIAGVQKFISGETMVSQPSRWMEKDGIIYLSLTSDGTSGPNWVKRLQAKSFLVSENAKSILRSRSFIPTALVTTMIAICKGSAMLDPTNIRLRNVDSLAEEMKFIEPNLEIACLFRERYSDDDIRAMGLKRILVMHKPVLVSGYLLYLGPHCTHDGRGITTYLHDRIYRWDSEFGFAYAIG